MMKTFELNPTPERLDDHNWQRTSTGPCKCWVRAENADDAREKVAHSTLVAIKLVPGVAAVSPWRSPEFSTCIARNSVPGNLGYGVILTNRGTFTVK
jgi:hypothetical protein